MLKIQGLHKKYGNYHALDGLDMELKDGALFGFVGPNGAGKTTTIKSMTGLLKPDRGTVELDGKGRHHGPAYADRLCAGSLWPV